MTLVLPTTGDCARMHGPDPPSALQDEILTVADRNPDMNPRQIAERCDCSTSYVRETLDEYRSSGLF